MAYPGGACSGPNLHADLAKILPYETQLKDGSPVVLRRYLCPTTAEGRSRCITFRSMNALLNLEIMEGGTYPFEEVMSAEQFSAYFCAYDVFILERATTEVTHPPLAESNITVLEDNNLVGCFYVKPNFPGRSNHICNAGFLVAPIFRKKGAGWIMGERFRHLAKALQYSGAMFNLVYENNIASNKLWGPLGFEQIGKVPRAGRMRTWNATLGCFEEEYYDAVMWYFDLEQREIPAIAPPWSTKPKSRL